MTNLETKLFKNSSRIVKIVKQLLFLDPDPAQKIVTLVIALEKGF
jgi:hypothetical protein